MRHNIKGTSLDITDELRAYVERQLAHADKFTANDEAALCDVELEVIPDGRSGKFRAEFTLALSGAVHRAEATGGTLHEAIDVAGGELMAELRKTKKKRLRLVRHAGVRVKEYIRGWRNKV